MLKLMLRKKIKGSISILLIIVMMPMLSVASVIVDASGYELSKSMVSSSADLTMNTALTYYDDVLQEVYGIFAVSTSADELSKNLETYFVNSLIANGIVSDKDEYNNSEMLKNLGGIFSGNVGEVIDIDMAEQNALKLSGVVGTEASNPEILKTQIVEFMKYRTPIYGTMSLLDGLSSLKKIAEQSKVTKAQAEVSEAIGDFNESCENAYKKIDAALDYYDENKNGIIWDEHYAEEDYKSIHEAVLIYEYNIPEPSYDIYFKEQTDDTGVAVGSFLMNTYSMFDKSVFDLQYTSTTSPVAEKDRYTYKNGTLIDFDKYLSSSEKEEAVTNFESYHMAITASDKYESLNNVRKMMADSDEIDSIQDIEDLKNFVSNYNALSEDVKMLDIYYDYLSSNGKTTNNINNNYETVMKNMLENSFFINLMIYDLKQQKEQANTLCKNVYTNIDARIKTITDYKGKLTTAKDSLTKVINNITNVNTKNENFNSKISSYEGGESDSFSEQMSQEYAYNKQSFSLDEINALKSKITSMETAADNLIKAYQGITYGGKAIKDIDTLKKAYEAYKSTGSGYYIPDFTIDSEIGTIDENTYTFWRYLVKAFEDAASKDTDDSVKAKDIVSDAKTNSESALSTTPKEGENTITIGSLPENYDTKTLPSKLPVAESTKSVDTSKISIGGGSGKAGKYKGFASMMDNMSSVVSSLFSKERVTSALKGARDNLFVTDYAFQMFSYYTYEKEKPEETERVTVTNIPINATNNQLYGAEIEYIIFGGSDGQASVDSAIGYIFAIRFMCNSVYAVTSGEIDAITVPPSLAIQAATCGIVPYKLPELVFELALALAESFVDLEHLKNGDKVPLFKNSQTWTMSINGAINLAREQIKEVATEQITKAANNVVSSFNTVVDNAGGMVTAEVDKWVGDYEASVNGAIKEGVSNAVSELTKGMIEGIEEQIIKNTSGLDMLTADTIINEAWSSYQTYINSLGTDNQVYKICSNTAVSNALYNLVISYKEELQTALDDLKAGKETALTTVRGLQSKISEAIYSQITEKNTAFANEISNTVTKIKDDYSNALKEYVGDSTQVAADKIIEITNDNIDAGADALISKLGVAGQTNSTGSVKSNSLLTFSYKDYLGMFLFLKLSIDSNNVMKRMADVIQLNVAKQSKNSTFALAEHYTYVQLDVNVRYNTLFLSNDWFGRIAGETKSGLDISYSGIRGY